MYSEFMIYDLQNFTQILKKSCRISSTLIRIPVEDGIMLESMKIITVLFILAVQVCVKMIWV